MKRYIIIAGVNGAGKSTLYQTEHPLKSISRINLDEILRGFGDWRNIQDVLKAGKITTKRLNEYLEQGVSFNQETTLCGRTIIKTIERAKEKGYVIELHYIGLESAEIAKERVKFRVLNGGHGISEDDIEKRYVETFINLKKVLPLCDLAALYDNSEMFRRFAIYKDGEIVRLSKKLPIWFTNIQF